MTIGNQLQKIADAAAEQYAEAYGVRSAIQLIPYAGGAIDALLGGRGAKLVAERQMALLSSLADDMQHLREDMIDNQYLNSEDFMHLLLKALDHAARVSRTERVRLLSKALTCAATAGWGSGRADESEVFLDLAAQIRIDEVSALDNMFALHSRMLDARRIDSSTNELQVYGSAGGKDTIREIPPQVVSRLIAKGLVREIAGGYWDYAGGAYVMTMLGVDLMKFLQADASPESQGPQNAAQT